MAKVIFALFCYACVSGSFWAKHVNDSLNRRIVTYEYLKAVNRAQRLRHPNKMPKQKGDLDDKYYDELQNLLALGNNLKHGMASSGDSPLGPRFDFERHARPASSAVVQMTALEVFLDDDRRSAEARAKQDALEQLIRVFEHLQRADASGAFWPRFYGAFDVSEYFPKFAGQGTPRENSQRLVPQSDQTLVVLLYQSLDYSLLEHLEMLRGQADRSFLHTRLRMAKSLAQGLALVSDRYTHCDIKPSNVLFELTFPRDDSELLEKFGIRPLRLKHMSTYRAKISGVEALAYGRNPHARRCTRGTPGFLPNEIVDVLPHDKVDVFSLAVTMLDLELAERGLGLFSLIHAEVFENWRQDAFKFTAQQIQRLRQHEFVEMLDTLTTVAPYKEQFFGALGDLVPDLEKLFELKPGESLRTTPLSKYLFYSADLFRLLVKTGLKVYWNAYFERVDAAEEARKWQRAHEEAQREIDSYPANAKKSKRFEAVQLQSRCFSERLDLARAEVGARIKLVNYYIRVVFSSYRKRSSIRKFREKVERLERDYESQNAELIQRVELCRQKVGDGTALYDTSTPRRDRVKLPDQQSIELERFVPVMI